MAGDLSLGAKSGRAHLARACDHTIMTSLRCMHSLPLQLLDPEHLLLLAVLQEAMLNPGGLDPSGRGFQYGQQAAGGGFPLGALQGGLQTGLQAGLPGVR
jgi:hypothetical protein